MTNLNWFKTTAEATTTEISKTFRKIKLLNKGGTITGNTRKEIEEKIGKKVVSKLSAKNFR